MRKITLLSVVIIFSLVLSGCAINEVGNPGSGSNAQDVACRLYLENPTIHNRPPGCEEPNNGITGDVVANEPTTALAPTEPAAGINPCNLDHSAPESIVSCLTYAFNSGDTWAWQELSAIEDVPAEVRDQMASGVGDWEGGGWSVRIEDDNFGKEIVAWITQVVREGGYTEPTCVGYAMYEDELQVAYRFTEATQNREVLELIVLFGYMYGNYGFYSDDLPFETNAMSLAEWQETEAWLLRNSTSCSSDYQGLVPS